MVVYILSPRPRGGKTKEAFHHHPGHEFEAALVDIRGARTLIDVVIPLAQLRSVNELLQETERETRSRCVF